MKLLNKVKISLLIAFFIVILFNLKVFAVTGVITEITVNMRKEPSTNSKKIRYVTQDDKVEVLEKVGEWYKIKFKGATGYVFGEYIKVDDSKLEVKEEKTNVEEEKETQEDTPTKEEEKIENIKEEIKDEEETTIEDVTTDVPLKLQIKNKTDIRLIPNITSSVIYTSKKEISIEVIEQIAQWSYIYVDNIYGWVRTDNIVEESANTEKENTSIQTETKTAYIKYSSVNLRKKASTSSTVLAKLKLNDEVTVLEKVNSTWSKVEVDGKVGYVSTDLLADKKQKETKKQETTTSRNGDTTSREETSNKEVVEEKKEETAEVITTTNKTDSKVEENKNDVLENKNETTINKTEISEDIKEEKVEANTSETKKEEQVTSKKEETISKTKGEEIVEYAKKYLGYKYVYGGSSPKTGFDCSGLTQYVYKHFGYTISRSSKAQANNGKAVSKSDLQPGDLLIFKNQSLTAIGHVGIYIGNNKMIHASEPGVGVVITNLNASGYNYNKRFVTARRII